MNNKECAKQTYEKFSNFKGNDHIAGDYAIEKILQVIGDFKIKNVLEIGLGIGSIADAVLTFSNKNNLEIQYAGTEANEFCLNALVNNVEFYNSIKLFSNIESILNENRYDLIIVDGSDEALNKVSKLISKHGIIFIEGGRASQVQNLKAIFPNYRYSEIISYRKPPSYGPFQQKWTGGGSLIFVNSTFSQKIYSFKQKIKTYAKRRLRKFIQ